MVKLGGFRLSNYFNKVRIVLLEKGIAHQEENIFFSQDEGFRKRSPMGKAPFLETEHGLLCESSVICEYLEDAYPDKPLLPRDAFGRAKLREFLQVLELHVELVARETARAPFSIALETRTPKPLAVTAELDVDFEQDKQELFRQAWTYTADHFFDEKYNGANWDALRGTYAPLVSGARTKPELHRLLNLMHGEKMT